MTALVLLLLKVQGTRRLFQSGRQRVYQCSRLSAVVPLDGDGRPAVPGGHDVLLYQALELIVEGADKAVRILGGLVSCGEFTVVSLLNTIQQKFCEPPLGLLPAAMYASGGIDGLGASRYIVSSGMPRSQCAAGSRRSGTIIAILKVATSSPRSQNSWM